MGKYSNNFIGNYLAASAKHQPYGFCAAYGNRGVTWGMINDRVNRLANAFLKMGIKKDDKITFMFHNTIEFIEINLAIQRAAAIPVPMNYRFTPREIEYQCNHSDSVLYLLEDMWLEPVKEARPKLKGIKEFIFQGPDCPQDMIDYEELISSSSPSEPDAPNGPDDVCVMVYTGGTTGFPKGVMLTYGAHVQMFEAVFTNLVIRVVLTSLTKEQRQKIAEGSALPGIETFFKIMELGPIKNLAHRPGTEKLIHKGLHKLLNNPDLLKYNYNKKMAWMIPSMPLFHDASYQILVMQAITGNIILFLTEGVSLDPKAIFEIAEREKVILMANVPTGWKKLVDSPEIKNFNLKSLAMAMSGGGINPVTLKKKMMEKMPGVVIMDLMGQTEMTPVTTMRIDGSAESLKERSVGRTIVQSKIVDEEGREVPGGQIGEILYNADTAMKGYYKDEEKTGEMIKDGWLKSGDLGYIDEEGEIRVVERKKECIITGGEKIFPQEVEEIIEEHPKVEKCCIIGIPDEEWGSTVRAVIVLRPGVQATPEEITEFCRESMAGYKKPRSIIFVEHMPISPVGKVLRAKIKEMYGT